MDPVELRKDVFAWFGAASYHAQCVEVELIIARLLLARRGASDPSADEWQKIEAEKRTMGGLFQFLRGEIPGDLSQVPDHEIWWKIEGGCDRRGRFPQL